MNGRTRMAMLRDIRVRSMTACLKASSLRGLAAAGSFEKSSRPTWQSIHGWHRATPRSRPSFGCLSNPSALPAQPVLLVSLTPMQAC